MKLKKGTFGIFPRKMCKGLHPYQQVLFIWLCSYLNENGECWPSLATLQQDTQLSKMSIIRHLKALEKIGYIKKTLRKNKKDYLSSRYEIMLVSESDKGLSQRDTRVVAERYQGLSQRGTLTKTNRTKTNELKIYSTMPKKCADQKVHKSRKTKTIVFSEIFEQAWANKPNRLGGNPKKEAFQKWLARLREGLTEELLLTATINYRSFCELTKKIGTEAVLMMRTFYGCNERYKDFLNENWRKTYDQIKNNSDRNSKKTKSEIAWQLTEEAWREANIAEKNY